MRVVSDGDDVLGFARAAAKKDNDDAVERDRELASWQGEAVRRLTDDQRPVAAGVIKFVTQYLEEEQGSMKIIDAFTTFFSEREAHKNGTGELTRAMLPEALEAFETMEIDSCYRLKDGVESKHFVRGGVYKLHSKRVVSPTSFPIGVFVDEGSGRMQQTRPGTLLELVETE
jgi:hypothetical protein